MRNVLRVAVPVVAAAAAISLGSSLATAQPVMSHQVSAAAMAANHLSKGFDIHNYSRHPMTLTNIVGVGGGDGAPHIGTVLQPGQSLHYEKYYEFFGGADNTTLWFHTPTGFGYNLSFDVTLRVQTFGDSFMWVGDAGHLDRAGNLTSKVSWSVSGGTMTFIDTPGQPAITVPATQATQQAALLRDLCSTGAACSFKITQTGLATAHKTATTGKWANNSTEKKTIKKTVSQTTTASSTLELSAAVKLTILKALETTIGAKSTEFTSKGLTQTEEITDVMPAFSKTWHTTSQAMIRTVGDYTIKIGNTTWILTGIAIDTPDPDQPLEHTTTTRPLTETEIASLPTGFTGPIS